MKLKTDNSLPIKTRLKELFDDWLFISGYLIALFLLAIGFYNLVLGGIPTFTESQSKRWVGLQLIYKHRSFAHSLLRSAIKPFSWQLGYMGAIRGVYQEDGLSIFLSTSAGILFLIFLLMGLLRKEKRHPADLLAGTQVQLNNSKRGWDKSPSLSIVFGLSSKTQ